MRCARSFLVPAGALVLSAALGVRAQAQTVTVPLGELDPGQEVTIEFQARVAPVVPPGTTQVANQGSVTAGNLPGGVATDDPDVAGAADLTVTPLAVRVDLALEKSESIEPVIAGSGVGNLVQVVTVRNNGLYPASGVVINETLSLPPGVALDAALASQGAVALPAWSVGTLLPGASATLTLTLTVDRTAPAGADLVCDTASVAGVAEPLVNTGDDAVTLCTGIARHANLVVAKSESVDPVVAGSGAGNLTHLVSVRNLGPSDVSGIVVAEVPSLPQDAALDAITPSQGSFVAPNWSLGALAVGAEATLQAVFTVGPTAIAGADVLCNTASVVAALGALLDTADDAATVCTSVARQVDLVVAKSESIDPVTAGSGVGNLTQRVTVRNAGPSQASGVVVQDLLAALPAAVSVQAVTPSQGGFANPTWTVGTIAAGASATLDVVFTVGAPAAAASDVVCDTATVMAANEPLLATGDDSATVCTSVGREVDLVVTKSGSVDPVVAGSGPGNLVQTVTVRNAGPSDASGVELSEVIAALPSGVVLDSVTPSQGSFLTPTWAVGGLAAQASATLAARFTVAAAAAPQADAICDTATVTAVIEARRNTGDDAATLCTSIVQAADLELSMVDAPDPLQAGVNLVYTITVHNAGPAAASGVVVSDPLPASVTLVSTAGCAEDPTGAPTCTLGAIAAGADATYTIEVAVGPNPPATISNTATVAGAEPDLDLADNSATAITSRDNTPPRVLSIDSVGGTGDGELAECEAARVLLHTLLVTFDEEMADPPGDDSDQDVTNAGTFLLVRPGADRVFDTASCAVGVAGDDVRVVIDGASHDVAARRVALALNGAKPLADDLYRLVVCAAAADLAGNPLDGDGDGTGGDELVRTFRVDRDNLLRNGHFDCDTAGYTVTRGGLPAALDFSTADADLAGSSGSGRAFEVAVGETLSVGQCVELAAAARYDLRARLRIDAPAGLVALVSGCSFFGAPACAGGSTTLVDGLLLTDSAGAFSAFAGEVDAPAGAASASCSFVFSTATAQSFAAFVDQAFFGRAAAIFSDGFESGDTSAWTAQP